MSLYCFERSIWAANGGMAVCGVDEAGRGPLAGPVYAAAVILPSDIEIDGLNDSKKLSASKREALYEQIVERAVAYRIEAVDEKAIDDMNILNATMLAMQRAVNGLSVRPAAAYIDGNRCPALEIPAYAVVRGDAQSASIAAASILAKVSRDRFLVLLAKQYPQYGFERHKGYGTRLHDERLREYGISPVHRKTFLKKWKGV